MKSLLKYLSSELTLDLNENLILTNMQSYLKGHGTGTTRKIKAGKKKVAAKAFQREIRITLSQVRAFFKHPFVKRQLKTVKQNILADQIENFYCQMTKRHIGRY